ncbi:MAG: hypothetical protein NT027_14525 [Proteobacteria bacterium]|nr:hypothetical protein [Pseudomonadota bacterium]
MKHETIYVSIGRTRSGKVIPYSPSVANLESIFGVLKSSKFTNDDFLDAFAVFIFLSLRAMRRKDESGNFEIYVNKIGTLLTPTDALNARSRANIKSEFDLLKLERSMAALEFNDF